MLNTEVHPEIAYRAERIVFSQGKPARIEGELTLLGITRSVELQISRYDCDDESVPGARCAILATASVKRSAFGMTRYMLFASDDVKLAIQAEGVLRPRAMPAPQVEELAARARTVCCERRVR
jgi:polyisoprenoid-binding protein YceI